MAKPAFFPVRVFLLMAVLLPSLAAAQLAQVRAAEHREAVTVVPIVVLLHGLARSKASMTKVERALVEHGYRVCNIAYPSTRHRIEVLADDYVLPAIESCRGQSRGVLHFVTHSMGGIVARYLLANNRVASGGRVVMLAPPNRGSEVVDVLTKALLLRSVFNWLNGPAGRQLGTAADSFANTQGPAVAETGVITGNRSFNWINSLLIAGPDDGKVSVEHAKLAGMADFLVLPVTHTYIMRKDMVILQVLHFLHTGEFDHDKAQG